MGVVYRADDLRRGVTVAIKTIRHVDDGSIYRFKQEFRALLGVAHPNLVTLHELISDGRDWFIVMEYVEGSTSSITSVAATARPSTAGEAGPPGAARGRRPGSARRSGRWSRGWSRSTGRASSTATSSPPTSWSRATGGPW